MSDNEIYDDDAEYDFEYDSASDMAEEEISLENRYYNAKSNLKSDPDSAINEFNEVIQAEGGNGAFSFKCSKQLLKHYFRNDELDKALDLYNKITNFSTGEGVARDKLEKATNKIIDLFSKHSDAKFKEKFYQDCLNSLSSTKNERAWIRTNLKLARMWFDAGKFDQLRDLLPKLYDFCKSKDGFEEERKGAHLLDIHALDIEIASHFKDNKRLKKLYQSASNVKAAFAYPAANGTIKECGGKMYMREGNYEAAVKDFFESFRSFDEIGSQRRIQVLKYLVLTNMLSNSEVNPFDSPELSQYKSHKDIKPIFLLVTAYQQKESKTFESILQKNSEALRKDPLIYEFFEQLTHTVRTHSFIKLAAGFTNLKLKMVAKMLNLADDLVLELVVNSLIDELLDGEIDLINGIIILNHKPKQGVKRKLTYCDMSITLDDHLTAVIKKMY